MWVIRFRAMVIDSLLKDRSGQLTPQSYSKAGDNMYLERFAQTIIMLGQERVKKGLSNRKKKLKQIIDFYIYYSSKV